MTDVKEHYAAPNLIERIDQALVAAGKSPDSLQLADLTPIDEFHLRGPMATDELIELLDVNPGNRVLDVGSGLGGPARRLADATGCHVTGVDLSDDFCAAGNELSRRVGLAGQVSLEPGNAMQLERFESSPFDAAWSIHVGMNIEHKTSLYSGVSRVLSSGARFLIFDILSADSGDIHFPVPWADIPAQSFLATVDEMSSLLSAAGFTIESTVDQSAQCLEFLDELFERLRQEGGPPALGLHLVTGPTFGEAIKVVRQNLIEGLVSPTVIHARKSERA